MANPKGILKKLTGGLKIAAVAAPFALTAGALGMMLGGLIGGTLLEDKAYDYTKTDAYQQIVIEETEQLKQQLDNGEITPAEYSKAVGKIGTRTYIEDLIESDIEGVEEYRALLKSGSAFTIAGICCMFPVLGFGIMDGFWVADVGGKLIRSAKKDFKWTPPVEEKPKEEKKDTIKDDLSSDEENLGSLDEFLENFSEKR